MKSSITKRTRSQVRETDEKNDNEEKIEKKYLITSKTKEELPPVQNKEEKKDKINNSNKIKKEKSGQIETVEKKKKELLKKSNWNLQNQVFKKINQWSDQVITKHLEKKEKEGEKQKESSEKSKDKLINESKEKIKEKEKEKSKVKQKGKEKNKEDDKKKEKEKTKKIDQENKKENDKSKDKYKYKEKEKEQAQSHQQKSLQKEQFKDINKKKEKKEKDIDDEKQKEKQEEEEKQENDENDHTKQIDLKEKSLKIKKPDPRKTSLNVQRKKLAKQCSTNKNNFYLRKQDCFKRGLDPSKAKQEIKSYQDKKRISRNQRCYRNKFLRKQISEGKNPWLEVKGTTIDESESESNSKQPLNNNQNTENTQNIKQQQSIDIKKENIDPPVKVIRAPKRKLKQKVGKYDCTTEQSIKILKAFSIDGGGYRDMVKDLGFQLNKIRRHLTMHFNRAIDIITNSVREGGRKINNWSILQKKQIVRELHRIRSTNRLLSEQNKQFREHFEKLMMSYNDPSLTLTHTNYNDLYRKIQAFVRGYCSVGTNKKKSDVKLENKDFLEENRPPLMEGGYMKQRSLLIKQEAKLQAKLEQIEESKKIDEERIIYQWTEQEERYLALLFKKHEENSESIIEDLYLKFGARNRWKDFQLLNLKLDHLVKLGLAKAQELTSRPYDRDQFRKEEEERKQKQGRLKDPSEIKSSVNSIDILTQFVYNNKKAVSKMSDSNQKRGAFENVSLIEKRIFGYVDSFKAKIALVSLMAQKFPPQQDIDFAVKVTKEFMNYAQQWQRKNNIIKIKSPSKSGNVQKENSICHSDISLNLQEDDLKALQLDEEGNNEMTESELKEASQLKEDSHISEIYDEGNE